MSWIALGLLLSIYLGVAIAVWVLYFLISFTAKRIGELSRDAARATLRMVRDITRQIKQISAILGYPTIELAKITQLGVTEAVVLLANFIRPLRNYTRWVTIILSIFLGVISVFTIFSIIFNHPAPLLFAVIPTLIIIFFLLIGYDPIYRTASGKKQKAGRPIALILLYVGILAMILLHGPNVFYPGMIAFSVFTIIIMVKSYKSYYFGIETNFPGKFLGMVFMILVLSLIVKFISPEIHAEILKAPKEGSSLLIQKIKQKKLEYTPGYTTKKVTVFQLKNKRFIRMQVLDKGEQLWFPDYFGDRKTGNLKGKKITLVRVITNLGDRNLYIPLDAIKTGFPSSQRVKKASFPPSPSPIQSQTTIKPTIPPRPKNLRGDKFFYLPPGKVVPTVIMDKNDVVKIYTLAPYSCEIMEIKTGPLVVSSTAFQYPQKPPLVLGGDLRLRSDYGTWVGIEFIKKN